MEEVLWLTAALVVAGMIWFSIWIWRQRGDGMIERRAGRPTDDMPTRLPPD